jgi:sortase, SrtB family
MAKRKDNLYDEERPQKKKKRKKTGMDPVSRVILVISVIVFIGSGGYLLYKYFGEPLLEQMELASYKSDYQSEQPSPAEDGVWSNDEETEEEERLEDGTLASFKDIRALNGDVVGWITIPNTLIDYPVVQTKNNVYYLGHNINKESNGSGCPFLDYRNDVKPGSGTRNLIIYGHHRRNGTMFAQLKKYNDVDFYKENPVIRFDTIYERSEWIIFSNFRATTTWATGTPFNYIQTEFKDDAEFLKFVGELKKRSLIDTPVEVRGDDQILLLSTCSYEKSNWRMVIAARRVRADEKTIDINSAVKAAHPLMP